MATKRVQLIIRGRVTGVFFRAATQREARRLGITGWVKNRNDGSIEFVAEGEEDAIKEIIGWAHHGPSAARVEHVDVRWRGYTGEYADFQIVE
jgi:acylphosphatase